MSPSAGSAANQVFQLVFSDTNGGSNLRRGLFIVNGTLNAAAGCYVEYNRITGQIGLVNDTATAWTYSPIAPNILLQNSQCQVTGASSYISGLSMYVSVALAFKPGFSGSKNLYLLAEDLNGVQSNSSQWTPLGTWSVPGSNVAPLAVSVTPNVGTGASQNFQFVYSDQNGGSDLKRGLFLINSGLNGVGACYGEYDLTTGNVGLVNDAGNGWTYAQNSSNLNIENNQCKLLSSNTYVAGNNLTVSVNISFKPAFAGAKSIWLLSEDLAGVQTVGSWQSRGTWTVTGINTAPMVVSAVTTSGSGALQNFQFTYSDVNGFTDLRRGLFLFNSTLNNTGACFGEFNRLTGNVGLVNDAGSGWSYAPISNTMALQNSQCQIMSAAYFGSGNVMTLIVQIAFKPAFNGAKALYLLDEDQSNAQNNNGNWVSFGTWTVSNPQSFYITATQPPVIAPGSSASVTVNAVGLNGFNANVALSYDPDVVPLTTYGTFNTFNLPSGQSTIFTITTLNSVLPGTYSIPITGQSGNLYSTTMVTVTVAGAPAPPKDPRHFSGCEAIVYGSSQIRWDAPTKQVTGESYTEVNYCAQIAGYTAGVIAGIFKGAADDPTQADPSDGSARYGQTRAQANVSTTSPDGDSYDLLTLHLVKISSTLAIPHDYYGHTMYRDPLGFSILPVTQGRGNAQPNDNFYGTYYEYVSFTQEILVGLTEVSVDTSDVQPLISSVSPSDWQPGSSFSLAVQGTGFGTSPLFDVHPSSGVTWNVVSVDGSGTQMQVNVSVDAGASPGGRTVAVTSRGASGNGFAPGPGKWESSNSANVRVLGSSCDATINNDGQVYSLSGPDYRSATIPLSVTSSCSGSVTWSIFSQYVSRNGRYGRAFWGPFNVTGSLNQIVNFAPGIGVGGRAFATATIFSGGNTTSTSATFYVTGADIPSSVITNYLTSIYSGYTSRLLTGIADKESNYYRKTPYKGQFSEEVTVPTGTPNQYIKIPLVLYGVAGYWPTESFDGGSHIGLMQNTANGNLAFDWQANANAGNAVMVWANGRSRAYANSEKSQPGCSNLRDPSPLQLEDNALMFYTRGYRYPRSVAQYVPNSKCNG